MINNYISIFKCGPRLHNNARWSLHSSTALKTDHKSIHNSDSVDSWKSNNVRQAPKRNPFFGVLSWYVNKSIQLHNIYLNLNISSKDKRLNSFSIVKRIITELLLKEGEAAAISSFIGFRLKVYIYGYRQFFMKVCLKTFFQCNLMNEPLNLDFSDRLTRFLFIIDSLTPHWPPNFCSAS